MTNVWESEEDCERMRETVRRTKKQSKGIAVTNVFLHGFKESSRPAPTSDPFIVIMFNSARLWDAGKLKEVVCKKYLRRRRDYARSRL